MSNSKAHSTIDVNKHIDLLNLERQYQELQIVLKGHNYGSGFYYDLLIYKTNKLFDVTEANLLTVDSYTQILNELRENFNYSLGNPLVLDIEAVKYQLLEFVETDDLSTLEQAIFEFELRYEDFTSFLQELKHFKPSELTRKMSYLEVVLKLILNPKQRNSRKFNHIQQIKLFLHYLYELGHEIKQLDYYYLILRKPLKQLYLIAINYALYQLQEKKVKIIDFFCQLNEVFQNQLFLGFINRDFKITVLYTLAKITFPALEQCTYTFEKNKIDHILQLITEQQCDQHISLINSWDQLFLYLQLQIMKEINNKSDQQMKLKQGSALIKLPINQLQFIDQLWFHVSINFTQQMIKLKNSVKRIISHNVYALINLFCTRFNKLSLQSRILDELMITPFEDDILRMKMCISLYQNEEFTKLHQLVQSLLASEKIKDHPFRQIIIDLCSVFTGIQLGKQEEGLCFARLNLEEYEHSENKQTILDFDTILTHIGYSYLNMGRSSKYINEKNTFSAKAIEYLERSLKINEQNYLVHFNLSKLYAYLRKTDEALAYAKKACSINKGDMNSLVLCAILYSAKDENQKALVIIEQIIKENPNKPILYLIRASILSEKYLLVLQKDKELNASEQFGGNLTQLLIKKHQKSKDATNILQNLQKALYGIAKQVPENDNKEFFTAELVHLKTLQSFDVDPMTYISYRNCLLHTIDLLIKIDFLDIALKSLELIDDGSSVNEIEKLFFIGQIQEKQNKYEWACQTYEEVLKDDFYHVRTMCSLALLYLKHYPTDPSKIQRANELLIVASKFDVSHFVCFGFALLNQIQENNDLSNEYLLKALELVKNEPVISVGIVPDRLFFIQ